MDELITLSEESVPLSYREDSLPGVQTLYGVKLYTKSVPDEKEIAQVYINNHSEIRVGWMIPVLSMISLEHEYSENVYFRKHVYEAMKFLNGKELHESMYVLVYSKRLLDAADVTSDGELSFSFVLYGIYPYCKYRSIVDVQHKIKVISKLVVAKSFNFDFSVGFFKFLVDDLLPAERNGYARFMFFYQIYELAMEMVFYKKVNELKIARSHLGIIRKKIEEYNSEGKLIAVLYAEMGMDKNDPSLAAVAKSIFEDLKEEVYYTSTNKSAMLYDIRNVLVHSYYRFSIEDSLSYLASYIEDEAFYVLNYIFSVQGMKEEMDNKYFYARS
ncbi:hypothetical protein [Janthinobacterium sp. FW305-128]|uniref:hypothetical protein n=1 Tax=Janthinobacterium sp. FW305-128 TaxID=2775055 RepID=UPI001E4B7DA9|nr:hypothetical protein [Janthinobacterium sp. FW305-128]MCC7681052.1 hypothetical protein [Janthinobacterium sp. FW305-128]